MKKRGVTVILVISVLILSIGFVSANWFTDLFGFGDDSDLEGELASLSGGNSTQGPWCDGADFNEDGNVDGVDFGIYQASYPKLSGATHADGDADGDGDVDGIDYGIYQANYPSTNCVGPVEVICTDTDGGRNIFENGTTRGLDWGMDEIVTKTDHCITEGEKEGRLNEYYCYEINGVQRVRSESFGPEDDCKECFNGACLPTSNATCTDTDGGLNYYVKGYLNNYLNTTFEDYCLDSITLLERYCTSDPNMFTQTYNCSNGCLAGACLPDSIEISKGDIIKNREIFYVSTVEGMKEIEYKGSDKITASSPKVKFEITGEGTKEVSLRLDGTFWLKTAGRTLNFRNVSSAQASDFDIMYTGDEPTSNATCTDTDGGLNYYVEGFSKSGLGDSGSWDSCYDSIQLVEYYCDNSESKKLTYNCPVGCSYNDGICKGTPEAPVSLALVTDRKARLIFDNSEGTEIQMPLAFVVEDYNYSALFPGYKLGYELIFNPGVEISRNQYFVLNKSYLVQYKGSDDLDGINEKVKFDVKGIDSSKEVTLNSDGSSVLKLGGISFNFINTTTCHSNDCKIKLSGGPTVENPVEIITNENAKIIITKGVDLVTVDVSGTNHSEDSFYAKLTLDMANDIKVDFLSETSATQETSECETCGTLGFGCSLDDCFALGDCFYTPEFWPWIPDCVPISDALI